MIGPKSVLLRVANFHDVANFDFDHPETLPSEALQGQILRQTPVIQLPKRIILVRHAESLGNVDENAYVAIPDWQIPLTSKGKQESLACGDALKSIIGDEPIYVYASPYLRTKQTLLYLISKFNENQIIGIREEPRLTEQQFGNFQDLKRVAEAKKERIKYGRFYYRFLNGESGLDVYNRISSFVATLFRDFANDRIKRPNMNVIIVTHGLTMRLFLMRWFQYSIKDFEETENPPNASIIVMERKGSTNEAKPSELASSKSQLGLSGAPEPARYWFEIDQTGLDIVKFKKHWRFQRATETLQDVPTVD